MMRLISALGALVALLALCGTSGARTQLTAAAPWIAADKPDYAPGSTVHLTGGNWEPGEEVRILTNDTLGNTWSQTDNVIADPSGAITADVVLPNYFVSDYSVTATSVSGTASTTFTDAVNYQFLGKDGSAHLNAGAEEDLGSVTSGSSVSATCPAGLTAKGTGLGGGQSSSYAISYVSAYGDNAALSSPASRTQINPASGTFNGNNSTCTSLTISTSGLADGTYHAELQMRNTGGATATTDFYFFKFTVVQPRQATSVSVIGASGTYGGSGALTASLTAGGSPLSGKSISFTLNGTGVGTATTDGSGVATLGGVSLAGINAGTLTGAVGVSFAGDASFLPSNGSGNLTVAKADSSTTVSCPASVLYDGSAKAPCTATVTGAGGLNAVLGVGYANNIAAGTATASASYAGDANHNGSNDFETFTIAPAGSTTSVTCPATSLAYDGSAQTPCTAMVMGAGGLSQALVVSYTDNVGAGTATASAAYAGDGNHSASTGAATFTIDKANSTTSVSCPPTVTYDGSPQTPCSATATGAGGLNQPLAVGYANNTMAGTATATASFSGDANHHGSSDSASFTIAKSDQTISFAAPFSAIYGESFQVHPTADSGLAVDLAGTPGVCSVTEDPLQPGVFGVTMLTGTGTCVLAASQAGDANHNAAAVVTRDVAATKASQSIAFDALADKTFGDDDFDVSATASSGLGVGFAAAGSCSLASSTVHIGGAGSCTITASQEGNDNYDAATDVAQSFIIEKAASIVTVSCDAGPFTYTGSPYTPCSAGVTGAGSLNLSLAVDYSDNTDAGTAIASATYAGDADHLAGGSSATFTIDRAPSEITITCPDSRTYTGDAIEPCSARSTGAGALDVYVTVSYAANVDVGTATASATYAGDENHYGSSGSGSFTIEKAASEVTVACAPGPFVYTGSAHTPCAAKVTGAGGLDVDLTVSYSDDVAAGTATASSTYGGDANHFGDSDSATFTIEKAPSQVEVDCLGGPFTYTGSPHSPCSANVTGAGGLDQPLAVNYGDNVDAGSASASAAYDGDANHLPGSASTTFTINKASSDVTLSCPGTQTYTGSPIEPCTARATGVGGLDVDVAVSYGANVDAGTAAASATYAGDPNHFGDSDSASFTIEKAPSTVSVACAGGPFTYNASPQTPCSAKATGTGALDVVLVVSYSNNVNAGAATASASYAGDPNHLGSSGSATFPIGKATPTVSVIWDGWTYDGAAHPATGAVTGVGGAALGSPSFTYYSGTGTSGTPLPGAPSAVGSFTVLASYAGSANYTPATRTKAVSVLYRWDGFLQPINDTAHQGLYESSFKLGSTVPAKFQLKKGDGTVVQAGAPPVFSRSTTPVSCDTQIAPETFDTDVAFTGTTFRWDGQQYIYNWSTKGLKAGEYRIYAALDDGSKQYVDICLR